MKKAVLYLITSIFLVGCAHNRIEFGQKKRYTQKEQTTERTVSNKETEDVSTVALTPINIIKEERKLIGTTGESAPLFFEQLDALAKNAEVLEKPINAPVEASFEKLNTSSIKKQNKNWDTSLYLLSALMVLSTIGLVNINKRFRTKVARWANQQKYTSRVLITLAQLGIGFAGYKAGAELLKMGYEISSTAFYTIGAIGGTVFLASTLHDLFIKNANLPGRFFAKHAGMSVIAISLFASSLGLGNGQATDHVLVSSIGNLMATTIDAQPCDELVLKDGRTLSVIIITESDKAIRYKDCDAPNGIIKAIPLIEVEAINYKVSKAEKVELKQLPQQSNDAGGVLGIWIFLAIILAGILLFLSCAAICAWGGGGVLIAILCLLLYVLFHIGMANWYRKEKYGV